MPTIFFIVLLFNFNIFEAIADPMGSPEPDTCEITLQSCPVDPKRATKGVKGVMGNPGPRGPPGDQGPQGDAGPLGLKGEKGDNGSPGLPGPRGEKGSEGPRGTKGADGDIGLPGSCNCTCRNIGAEFPISCKYKLYPLEELYIRKSNPFLIQCAYKNDTKGFNATCLKPSPRQLNETILEKLYFKHDNTSFWLSQHIASSEEGIENKGFDLQEFYFGYDMSQLEFLQQYSSFVTQKIRYHCKNSFVIPENESDVQEKAMQLLSWKDQLIGPRPTSHNPIYYNIEKDNCKDSATSWKYAEISLMALHESLPVIDFHIRDIRDGEQKFYLELVELCFHG